MERTLVVIKPDGVQRNLAGEIIKRFQDSGLRLVALKMMKASEALVAKHYPMTPEYCRAIGEKSAAAGEKIADFEAHGRMIVGGLRKYITNGPVVAMVLEGENAIKSAREITGYTDPAQAKPGTIRGDLGEDSILAANREKRPCRNLTHASGNEAEAKHEMALWFSKHEMF